MTPEQCDELLNASKAVIQRWTARDLAGAVRELAAVIEDIEADAPQAVEPIRAEAQAVVESRRDGTIDGLALVSAKALAALEDALTDTDDALDRRLDEIRGN
jgi:hypothetical protein